MFDSSLCASNGSICVRKSRSRCRMFSRTYPACAKKADLSPRACGISKYRVSLSSAMVVSGGSLMRRQPRSAPTVRCPVCTSPSLPCCPARPASRHCPRERSSQDAYPSHLEVRVQDSAKGPLVKNPIHTLESSKTFTICPPSPGDPSSTYP